MFLFLGNLYEASNKEIKYDEPITIGTDSVVTPSVVGFVVGNPAVINMEVKIKWVYTGRGENKTSN